MDCITATAASEVLVFEIQLDCCTAALIADESWPREAEAGFDPLQFEALNAITVEELYHKPIDFHAGNEAITQT